jgi:hypothetical protein
MVLAKLVKTREAFLELDVKWAARRSGVASKESWGWVRAVVDASSGGKRRRRW